MTTTVAPKLKNQDSLSVGLVESATVNSITDFIPSRFVEGGLTSSNAKADFANTFICHIIFYAVFCVSLVLHILIDLGLGSFVRNKFVQLMALVNKTFSEKGPAFA